MKLKLLRTISTGIPVSDSYGYQVVVGLIEDGYDEIVLYYDSSVDKYFIARIASKLIIEKYSRANFQHIEDDQAWNAYYCLFSTGVNLGDTPLGN